MGRKDTPAPFADAPMHSGIFVDCISPERKKSIFRFGRKQVDVGNARRDQPDQRLHLFRNEETLAWELERVEMELWKAPPEPLLEQVSTFLYSGSKEWTGTPTELVAILGVDMKPNALTRRLNVNAGRLLNEYGIRYESSRSRNERTVKLAMVERS